MTNIETSQGLGADAVPVRTVPQTGDEFLESLRDDREIWIYGEKVDDVTTHPAFRNSARSLARLYDAMHDPSQASTLLAPTDTGSGGVTHPFFKVPTSKDALRQSRDAIRAWQDLSFGWMGRSPDYKAALMTTLGANPEFFGEYAPNARHWYKESQEKVLHIGHAIVHPPVDRDLPIEQSADVFVHVDEETDSGLIVSGAKVVATGAPTTQYVWVSHFFAPGKDALESKKFALTFIAPTGGPGVKFFARASYESNAARTGSPFDYPLSSRMDENDSIIVFDRALIPWENVLIYDAEGVTRFQKESNWSVRGAFQASIRMTAKLDFLVGALSKALDIKGSTNSREIQVALGEVLSWREVVAGLTDGMIEGAGPGFGTSIDPKGEYAFAYAAVAPGLYVRVKEIIQTIVSSGLIYLNSNAVDFLTPEVRPYLDRFMRGSNGLTALDRSKTMKLLWDAIGSEFGGRHELYEINYFGQTDQQYLSQLARAKTAGSIDRARNRVDACMAEYDLNGWTAPDLINPTDVSNINWPSAR